MYRLFYTCKDTNKIGKLTKTKRKFYSFFVNEWSSESQQACLIGRVVTFEDEVGESVRV